MKAQDLRIGNEINYKGINCILSIEDFSQLEDDIEDSIIKPIKLTENWLLCFGFRIERMKRLDHFKFGKGRLIGHFYKNKRFLFRNVWAEIKYVHQLQNLYFALTGKELIIKNTKNEQKDTTD